jgi:hypothetical protein
MLDEPERATKLNAQDRFGLTTMALHAIERDDTRPLVGDILALLETLHPGYGRSVGRHLRVGPDWRSTPIARTRARAWSARPVLLG